MASPASTLSVVQGATLTATLQGYDRDGSIPTQFLSTDVLTGTVWLAQAEPAVVTFTPTWFAAPVCQFTVSLSGVQTATLALDAEYNVQVFATRSGTTYCIGWLYLQVLPAAGSQAAAAPPDLITGAYAAQMLAAVPLSAAQLEQIPTSISAASKAIRRYCGDRDFTRMTYTREFRVELNGEVRLDQIPVNQVLRVQAQKDDALTIANTSGAVQLARVAFTLTGDYDSGQTITGLTLTTVASGIATVQPVPYVANQTILSLATAITALGNGWSATVTDAYGLWPVTELVGAIVAKGAIPGQNPGSVLQVYSNDLADAQLRDQSTGLLWVGRTNSGFGPKWGPTYLDMDTSRVSGGLVKVTYDAGFGSVPTVVQLACVELVKSQLERLRTDLTLQSESAGKYSYQIAAQIEALPFNIRQGLSSFRLHHG